MNRKRQKHQPAPHPRPSCPRPAKPQARAFIPPRVRDCGSVKERVQWDQGKLKIGQTAATDLVARMKALGLIQEAKPRNWKSPEERAAYRKRRRRSQTRCMARIREQRWCRRPCPEVFRTLIRLQPRRQKKTASRRTRALTACPP